jgi:predicted nucleic acid-binding protein
VIVVDTSVWVDVLRNPASRRGQVFQRLLDADDVALALPVRLELMSGVARHQRAALRRGLSALPVLLPSEETWRLIESWVEPAADAGARFSVTDLLIAGLAHELTALVWSIDSDFASMEQLGIVRLYAEQADAARPRVRRRGQPVRHSSGVSSVDT